MVKKHFWWYVTSGGRTFWQTMEVQGMGHITTERKCCGKLVCGVEGVHLRPNLLGWDYGWLYLQD